IFAPYAADFPSLPVYWKSLFACYANLRRLLEESGRVEEIPPVQRDALSLYAKLSAAGLEESGSQLVLDTLPRHLRAVLMTRSRPAEMIEAFRQAADVSETVVVQHPARADARFLAATWQQALGSLLAAAGRTKESEAAYRAALAQYGTALQCDP